MRFVSATASKRRAAQPATGIPEHNAALDAALRQALLCLALVGAVLLGAVLLSSLLGSVALAQDKSEEKTVLLTRKGETSIQVTESEEDGHQIVRVRTVFRGEENVIVLNIDQPVYEIEIPLSIEQVVPQTTSAAVRGPEGQFQDLMIAQWLQKAQQSMLDGDYNGALRQVDTVLQVNPDNVQALTMKGSVYYALGNYELASETWEYVLTLDPTNREVRDFRKFLKERGSAKPPPLPGGQPAPGAKTPQGATGGAPQRGGAQQ